MELLFGRSFGRPMQMGPFQTQYSCYSTAMAGRTNVEEGDKVLLPPSALDVLAQLQVEYPMLFEITNPQSGKKSHCGVLEFSADEGRCYMPFWMMQNLFLEEGSLISIKNVSLNKATFVKFRAQSVDFLEVANQRALLEVALRKFTCLTVGDIICIPHMRSYFYLEVCELKPAQAVSIVETDCDVDFDEPLGYKDSKYYKMEQEAKERVAASSLAASSSSSAASVKTAAGEAVLRVAQKARVEDEASQVWKFQAFSGNAKRIDGKSVPGASVGVGSSSNSSGSAAVASMTASSSSTSCASSSTSSAISSAAASTSTSSKTTQPQPQPQQYQSRIGDKYSKVKTSASAFTGPARTLK